MPWSILVDNWSCFDIGAKKSLIMQNPSFVWICLVSVFHEIYFFVERWGHFVGVKIVFINSTGFSVFCFIPAVC